MTNLGGVPKKLKIAFIDYVLEPDKPGRSGLSDIVWDMADELVNQGHEAHIIASYPTTIYPDSRVIVHNFPAPPIGYRNLIGQLWLLKRAAGIAKNNRFDIVHAPEYVSTAVFATLGVKTPLVLTTPGNVYQRIKMGHGYEWWYVYFLKWAANVSARKCASIIAISKEMKQWWEWTGSPPEKTVWIPLGVNRDRFHFVPDSRDLLNLPSDKVIFLYVGRFSKEKGIVNLINALELADLTHYLDRSQVVLIGRGPERPQIEAKVRSSRFCGGVTIKDWVDQNQLALWYSAADVVLMSSWYEPFGRVIMEALACGTPVIATNTGASRDLLIERVNGFIFPARDKHALSQILRRALTEPELLKEMRSSIMLGTGQNNYWPGVMERIVKEVYYPVLTG